MTDRQTERVRQWVGTGMGWISHLSSVGLSLQLGAWRPRSLSFIPTPCTPHISISPEVSLSFSVRVLGCWCRVQLCRALGRPNEGSRAETSTWRRWDPPCRPVALCRLVMNGVLLRAEKGRRGGRNSVNGGISDASFLGHYFPPSSPVPVPPLPLACLVLPRSCGMSSICESWGSEGQRDRVSMATSIKYQLGLGCRGL